MFAGASIHNRYANQKTLQTERKVFNSFSTNSGNLREDDVSRAQYKKQNCQLTSRDEVLNQMHKLRYTEVPASYSSSVREAKADVNDLMIVVRFEAQFHKQSMC